VVTRTRLTAVFFLLLICAAASVADAGDSRLQHVSLLTARDRVSLVFELTGEPEDVSTRRVSAAVLELDAGPVVGPARPTSFMAPPGVRFVMGVSIQGASRAAGRLKARITLLERARSTVRVLGRRVYVDFSSDAQGVTPVSSELISGRRAPQPSAPASPVPPPVVAPAPLRGAAHREAVQPAVERFEQLMPFLLSAVASPSEPVLKAIESTLAGIQALLTTIDVPAESQTAHDLLAQAVATALTSVNPAFNGDRAAQARQAQSLLGQAKNGW
jgi:hypothetical protein